MDSTTPIFDALSERWQRTVKTVTDMMGPANTVSYAHVSKAAIKAAMRAELDTMQASAYARAFQVPRPKPKRQPTPANLRTVSQRRAAGTRRNKKWRVTKTFNTDYQFETWFSYGMTPDHAKRAIDIKGAMHGVVIK